MTDDKSPRTAFCELTGEQLRAWLAHKGFPNYRARQIQRWLFGKRASSFADMHTVPARLRGLLDEAFNLLSGHIVRHLVASDRTEKLLLRLDDGEYVECVLMREVGRRTVCISTQVGCGMGCVFCASGLLGLKRNLSTGEILSQILYLDRLLAPGERITNVVVMGIGEPLANLPSLLPALKTLHDKQGLGLGARRITISTVGLPERIRELAACGRPFRLAVSLHAPGDDLRNRLVPVNERIGIAAILSAADDYFAATGRRVTYEYILLRGVNDGPSHARQLADLLSGRNAHVNLIPMNDVAELLFVEPLPPRTRAFAQLLEKHGTAATVRKRKGADIDAACGQLRLNQQAPIPT